MSAKTLFPDYPMTEADDAALERFAAFTADLSKQGFTVAQIAFAALTTFVFAARESGDLALWQGHLAATSKLLSNALETDKAN